MMCGITGFVDWERNLEDQRHVLDAMVEKLTARGPDGSGCYITSHVALGHRRLSVMDPANGAQPMLRERGDDHYAITYNGELYNMVELRRDLETRGYRFRTNCDTEILLTAYIEWGANCVERFNGIFAFAIWDEARRQLFLARDRIGVKPLFYAVREQLFIFGSELKALLAHPTVKPVIDREGLAEVFAIGPARTPGHGIFCHVNELKPGHSMIFDYNGVRIQQYWKLHSQPHSDDFQTTVRNVRDLLEDTVKRQLIADVPVCTLLSGGLDSSALTALAALFYKQSGVKVETYSVDYRDNDIYFKANSFQPNEDAPWVEKVSKYFDTTHHNVLLDIDDLAKSLPDAAISRDLPGMADIDTSLYLFCREIKKSATVALSGECADEVFGGYPWFYREDMIGANTFPWALKPELRAEWLSQEVRTIIDPLTYVEERYQQALDEVPRLPGEDNESARMREIFFLSLTRWMPTLLDRKDRMSMAFGLEIRVPYCDHRLVEYVWNIPWAMKNYRQREKGLLRQALTGLLPDDVLWRKKSPYPKTHNPDYLATVKRWVTIILQDSSSPLVPLVNRKKILELVKSDSASNIPWFGQLMSGPQFFAYLIQADTWLRKYKVDINL
ncbi:Asparagine synthetase [glutamine-hydrolyzing] 3 [bioreactor metagenome]|uniref:Asparagine synthetase [glutamine-hydrolyzing] 3 n=1 Tax=bioreactor metagenome TaxID=1076179 RepID=A0A644YP96_9ZZZZ